MSAFLIGRQGQALSMRLGNDRAANYGTYPLVGNSRDLADFQSRSTPRAKKMGNCGWFAPDGTM
jgi:hypothetical protein